MQVVGLAGRKGSGKSTVAQHLVDAHGFVELSFAAPLKEAALILDPLIPAYGGFPPLRLSSHLALVGGRWDSAKKVPGVRSLLQKLGDAMRHIDPDIFLGAVKKALLSPATGDKIVVSDVRFPNEVETVKWWGGGAPIVYIDRPGTDDGDSHRSEQFDQSVAFRTVVNDGSVEDLFTKVDNVLELVRA